MFKVSGYLVIGILLILGLDIACELSPTTWRDRVRQDLNFIRENIKTFHPGAHEVEISSWLDKGYELTLEKVDQINNREDATAVIKYYVNGFSDLHVNTGRYNYCIWCFSTSNFSFRFWNGAPKNPSWAGFQIDKTYAVKYSSPSWDQNLPAVGDKLVSCDGLSAKTIWQKKIYPYVFFNEKSNNSIQKAINLFSMRFPSMTPLLNSQKWEVCIFEDMLGNRFSYNINWGSFDSENSVGLYINEKMNSQIINVQDNGVTYISIPSFNFNEKEMLEFQSEFLKKLQTIENSPVTLIDLRFNTGGSSSRVFEVLESLAPNHLPVSKVVDDISYSRIHATHELVELLQRKRERINVDFTNINYDQIMIDRLISALRKSLYEKKSSIVFPIVSLKDFYSNFENVRTQKYESRIYVLTDGRCASACVIFLKLIRELDNVVHMGEHPHLSTIYTDQVRIYSKNGLMVNIPYRAVTRSEIQQFENLEPHIKYEGNFADEKQLKLWLERNVQ